MDEPTSVSNLLFAPLLPQAPVVGSDAEQLRLRVQAQIDAVAATTPPSGEEFVVRGFKLGGDAEGTLYVAQVIFGVVTTPQPGIDPAVEIAVGDARVDFEKCAPADGALAAGWKNLLTRIALATSNQGLIYEVQDDIGGAGGAPMIGALYKVPVL